MSVPKIKLSKYEVESLKKLQESMDTSELIDEHSSLYWGKESEWEGSWVAFKNFPPSDFSRALLVGYTEESFIIGNWYLYKLARNFVGETKVGRLLYVDNSSDQAMFDNHEGRIDLKSILRSSTKEEYEREMDERYWKMISRRPGEFRINDVLVSSDGPEATKSVILNTQQKVIFFRNQWKLGELDIIALYPGEAQHIYSKGDEI